MVEHFSEERSKMKFNTVTAAMLVGSAAAFAPSHNTFRSQSTVRYFLLKLFIGDPISCSHVLHAIGFVHG
jgi:hypothetical protein